MPESRRDRRRERRREERSVAVNENVGTAPEPVPDPPGDVIEPVEELAPGVAEEISNTLGGVHQIEAIMEVDFNDLQIPGPAPVTESMMAAIESNISGDGISPVADVDLHDNAPSEVKTGVKVVVVDSGKEPDVVGDPPADSFGHPHVLTDLRPSQPADILREKAEEQRQKMPRPPQDVSHVHDEHNEYVIQVQASQGRLLEMLLAYTCYEKIEDLLSNIVRKSLRDIELFLDSVNE